MKRSEMLDIIDQVRHEIIQQIILRWDLVPKDGSTGVTLMEGHRDDSEYLLSKIEEAGMLPPFGLKRYIPFEDINEYIETRYVWEPEDE